MRHFIRVLSAVALFPALSLMAAVAGPAPASAQSHPGDADLVTIDAGVVQLNVMGLLQAQVVPYAGADALIENGDPADRAGARIRRARLGFTGTLWGSFDFELTIQATPTGVNMLDAYMGWRPLSDIYLVVGARKVPFSRYAMASSAHQALSTRPMGVRAMAPFRQLGLTLEGNVGQGLLQYYIGVYNGFSRLGNFHEGISSGDPTQGNRFSNFAYAARFDLAPLGAVSHGIPDMDKGSFALGLGGAFYYDDGDHLQSWGAEGDLLIKVSGLHFLAEFIHDEAAPTSTPPVGGGPLTRTIRNTFSAELGYMILASQFGLTVRGELIDANTDVKDNLDQYIITGGLQYYIKRHHLKLGLDYTHRGERYGATLKNDSLLLQFQLQL